MKIQAYTPDRIPPIDLDWKSLASLIGEAREAVARFDETLLQNPLALFEIFKWKEAIASLRGQNIEADFHEVLSFALEKSADENRAPLLQKIVNAKEGLDFAIRWGKKHPLNAQFFCKIHAIVKKDAPNPADVGQIRKRQNWIGAIGCSIEEAYFYPPEAKKVNGFLKKLISYGYGKEKDPIVQAAIFFAQFLIIHPFMDGNGRVARLFIPVFLHKKGLISQPLLFLSGYFERHRLEYFRKLFHISEKGEWEEWICYFLEGVIQEANQLKIEAEEIGLLYGAISKELDSKQALGLFRNPARKKGPAKWVKKKILIEESSEVYLFEPLLQIVQ
ncbi:MAG: Fic family protein [Chlamydiota bacterium]